MDPRLVVVLVVLLAPVVIYVRGRLDMTPAERQEESTRKQWGDTNSALVCPHCQTQGQVRTMSVQRKKGISGGKAAALDRWRFDARDRALPEGRRHPGPLRSLQLDVGLLAMGHRRRVRHDHLRESCQDAEACSWAGRDGQRPLTRPDYVTP